MKIDEKIVERLNQLIKTGNTILGNSQTISSKNEFFSHSFQQIDEEKAFQWRMSCLQILENGFSKNSHFYINFEEASIHNNSITYDYVKRCLGILRAAKDDYENGYVFNTRTLIEAEIFGEFIEQAEELFNKGYFLASAVIAGCVLEDCLRKLCDRNSITLPTKATIEPMNVELAKVGIYSKLWQKKITALADLRNKAAHNLGGFTDKDVEDMIRDVRRFMEDYFS